MRRTLLLAATLLLGACSHTLQGLGKDIHQGGEAVGRAVQRGGEVVSDTAQRVGNRIDSATQPSPPAPVIDGTQTRQSQ
ncbi:entericidin [Crenobacter cavernae]|nr:entericidin [Crenobacter cavernae]